LVCALFRNANFNTDDRGYNGTRGVSSIWTRPKERCRFDILSCSRMNQLVREFFRFGHPDVKSLPENIEIAERAGYEIFNIYTLPEKAWIEDYYEILASRAKSLINHADVAVRDLALETITEIETFRCSEGSYGYVFFVLRRTR
jgi:hypothetical protein